MAKSAQPDVTSEVGLSTSSSVCLCWELEEPTGCPAPKTAAGCGSQLNPPAPLLMANWINEREFFIDNLLVRIHFIIEMIRWNILAPWVVEFPFLGSLVSTLLGVNDLRRRFQHDWRASAATRPARASPGASPEAAPRAVPAKVEGDFFRDNLQLNHRDDSVDRSRAMAPVESHLEGWEGGSRTVESHS